MVMPIAVIVYLSITLVVSVYQTYRGFMLQWILGIQQIHGSRRVILLCLADMFTFFACALSGFIALALLADAGIFDRHLPHTAGEATWLIFLAVYGVLGVTGKLPEILARINLPLGGGH
jgi:hypothetical protein